MGIFATILSKIFPSSHPAVTAAAAADSAAPASPETAESDAVTAAAAPATLPPAAELPQVDVEQVISAIPGAAGMNWRTSIVDLMKLLGLDSSLSARKALASELQYTGDPDDSATMNVWLHKRVMIKLAENGGKVPEELKN